MRRRAGLAAAERLASREFGVVGLPGQAFDPAHDTHVRLAFATVDEAGIAELARRLARSSDIHNSGEWKRW